MVVNIVKHDKVDEILKNVLRSNWKIEYDLLGRGSYTNTGYCPETSRDANGYNRN